MKIRTYAQLNKIIQKRWPTLYVRKIWCGIKLKSTNPDTQNKINQLTPSVGCDGFGKNAVCQWSDEQWLAAVQRKAEVLQLT